MDDLSGINFLMYRHNDVTKCASAGFRLNPDARKKKVTVNAVHSRCYVIFDIQRVSF